MMLQIKAGHPPKGMTAGVVFNEWSVCIKAAPVVKYMKGWTLAHVIKYCHNRGWTYEVIENDEVRQ
jgi:hypothetical protein